MVLVWTKSNQPLSLLIRWGLKEPVSHFAIVFDDKFTIHSNLLGLQMKWFNTFAKHATIVYTLSYKVPLEYEEEVYQSIMNNFDEAPYDFKAFFYFIYRGLLKRLFNIPFPQRSAFKSPKTFLCTEVAQFLPNWIVPKDSIDLSITSPYRLYEIIKQGLDNKEIHG